ncbi:helix-turn-helix domain-containing protein [Vibrio tritonius]|uniref:Helix-turn-helix domain-containing protein n=1 Tax=Vibrio tritonius TaxID=1435069 RepID=A0ABS7YLU3_9VIBR|nr:helix-turn-helix domain-containing protein [Vibrio tritonius]MCA2016653.1 helix-turn-helix domain-containing protein [Vibrio tritonius]
MFHLSSEEFFLSSDATVCTEVRSPQPNYPEHSHDFHELIIVSKGAGQHVLNDHVTNLAQNYICYISPKDRHLFDQVEDLYLTNILYRKNLLSYSPLLKQLLPHGPNDSPSWYISTETMRRVQPLLKQLDNECRRPTIDAKVMTEVLFQQLVVELARGRLTARSNNETDNKILNVIDWIQNNYAQDMSVGEIAEQFHLSSRTLSRHIKQVTNLSFNNYVHRVRINHAMNLLSYSDKSVTDIAFEVGYKDSNYFSTKFKRFTKQTPSDFR